MINAGMERLANFLSARLTEDEVHALNAADDRGTGAGRRADWKELWSGSVDVGDDLIITGDSQLSRHIERHDPQRVLAECAAKRRIISNAMHGVDNPPAWDNLRAQDMWIGGLSVCRDVLELLTIPYTEHEDFREEWRR